MDAMTLALIKKLGGSGGGGGDYVLTEADKAEIAELAAELVPSGGGGASEWKTAMEYAAITEDIGTLTVDTPGATEIEVYFVGISNNSDNSAPNNSTEFDLKVNNNTVGRFSVYVRTSGTGFARYITLTLDSGGVHVTRVESNDNSYANFSNVTKNAKRNVSVPIKTFAIVPVTSGMLIKAGAKIGIRYR